MCLSSLVRHFGPSTFTSNFGRTGRIDKEDRKLKCAHMAIHLVYAVIYIIYVYSETSLIRHSIGPENNVGLGGCWITECLLPYLSMVTVPHKMVRLERTLDYKGVGLERFHCI